MRTGSRLLKGSVFRNLELVALLFATLAMTPMLVRSMGDRLYGVWAILSAFVSYYGLLDFGLSSAAARYISQALGRGDGREASATAGTAFVLFSLLGAAALAVTGLAAWVCPRFLKDPSEAALFRQVVLLLGGATALGFPLKAYQGVLTSQLRYDILSYMALARILATNALIYASLLRGGGLWEVAAVTSAGALLQGVGGAAACRFLCPGVRVAAALFRRDAARAMFAHGWRNLVCGVSDVVRLRVDSLVIAAFLDVRLVTPYSVGVRLVDGFVQFMMGTFGMMQPVFSRYDGADDRDAIREALLRVTRLSTLASTYLGLSIIFFGRPAIERWMGPGYESGYVVAAILAAAFMIELPQSPGIQLLYGLSRHGAYAALNACEAVLNVALSIVLLGKFGLYGVALGTAAEIVVIKLFVLPVFIARAARLPVRAYLVDAILVTLLKAAAPLLLFYAAARGFLLPDYGRLALCAAAQTLFFAPIAYAFVLGADERLMIREVLASLLGRVPARAESDAIG